jgi:hypothetical protein
VSSEQSRQQKYDVESVLNSTEHAQRVSKTDAVFVGVSVRVLHHHHRHHLPTLIVTIQTGTPNA